MSLSHHRARKFDANPLSQPLTPSVFNGIYTFSARGLIPFSHSPQPSLRGLVVALLLVNEELRRRGLAICSSSRTGGGGGIRGSSRRLPRGGSLLVLLLQP